MLGLDLIFICPHCEGIVQVPYGELNCKIFRHAIYKVTINNTIIAGNQVDPHASKEYCDFLIKNDYVYGCCKPCKVIGIKEDGILNAVKCDYI